MNAAYHYELFSGTDYDLDEDFSSTNQSVTEFWDSILKSEMFKSLPENWFRMACALYISKTMKVVAEDAKASWDELPDWETFRSWKEGVWDVFHPDHPIYIPNNMSLREAYEKDSEWVKSTYREMRYEHYYSAADKEEDFETAYWGCAGRFDRLVLDSFHQKAEEWCNSGPLPRFWK